MDGPPGPQKTRKEQELTDWKEIDFTFAMFAQEGQKHLPRNALGSTDGHMRVEGFEVRLQPRVKHGILDALM